jgi:hypothetical protein
VNDTFRVIVPANLEKAEDGSWRVRGLASSEKMDLQGETIVQKGVDLSPIDKKRGVLNWDHNRGPENTIGVLDGYSRTSKGLYIEGRLFKNHSKAKAVREIMESLGESDRGRMGMSVEGKILERDPANPTIIRKCQINAVALTMNPVNAETFADLVKSVNAAQEVEFDAQEQSIIDAPTDEPTFTTTQVLSIVQKALGVGGGYGSTPPGSLSGGDALATEDMGSKKKKNSDKPKVMGAQDHYKPMKKMSKNLYKANIISILYKLQVLYPEHSRTEIWEAVKERLDTKFEKAGLRLRNVSGKEREHKLYEDARQREDYERNKDKSRGELNRLAEESGASKHDKAKIRAQADAAIQAGEDRDHVRPNVKG